MTTEEIMAEGDWEESIAIKGGNEMMPGYMRECLIPFVRELLKKEREKAYKDWMEGTLVEDQNYHHYQNGFDVGIAKERASRTSALVERIEGMIGQFGSHDQVIFDIISLLKEELVDKK